MTSTISMESGFFASHATAAFAFIFYAPLIFAFSGALYIIVHDAKGETDQVPKNSAECGDCEYCNTPKSNLCQTIAGTIWTGYMPDGTRRFSQGGKDIYHYMGCSTFAEYTVVPEIALAKINKEAPLDKACLLGCGI